MKHRNRKKVEDAYTLVGIPKLPKKPFKWNKNCSRWARQGSRRTRRRASKKLR